MANSIATATLIQKNLDKAAAQQALTGWMEGNAGKIQYNGGKEVKIPKLNMDGLGDYDRANGFNGGSITFEYETRTMTHDRGRSFSFDELTVDETGFAVTAATVMGEFQRLKVVPEIDATRLAAIAQIAIGVENDTQVEYGYTPAKTTIVSKIRAGIKAIRKAGYKGNLVCYVTYDVQDFIEDYYGEKLAAATFAINGVDTRVPSVNGVPIIPVIDECMYTKLKFNDGKTTGQTAGGYTKADDGLDINFEIMTMEAPIAVQKTDNMRIFSPEVNQDARAWKMDYRKFHDLWVPDNKQKGLYVNIKDAKPVSK
ncbi:hypothetical protein FDB15_18180 [Clostridium botulinum]|uniref:hypothetical protein n=1 Tax=unclassified Clostridium TaxID=2614128 RepID=UPI0005407954|nr:MULTISPECIES: hypothetical protein [unclassified Clostridium]AIY80962.1 putative prophage protein [Clostridium botulinum 202F]KAI3344999.1 hypothetical protein CIT17_15400 [Clostridium botulinum]KON14085.1 prophage protein [Clostridium botulinum]MBY6986416.1 hypothetical protein [Clostridium botulinum]MBY7009060.1 hypothetical protein [Clostridium botulinum]